MLVKLETTRERDSTVKQHQLKTGGGAPIQADPNEDTYNLVRAILPHIDFTLQNPWDSTANLETYSDYEDLEYLDESLIDNEDDIENNPPVTSSGNCIQKNSQASLCRQVLKEQDSNNRCTGSINSQLKRKSLPHSNELLLDTQPSKLRYTQTSTPSVLNPSHKPMTNQIEQSPGVSFEKMSYKKPSTSKILQSCLDKCQGISSQNTFPVKKKIPPGIEIEQDVRLRKLEDAIMQEAELHTEKMSVVTAEKDYWLQMKESAKAKTNANRLEILARESEVAFGKIEAKIMINVF